MADYVAVPLHIKLHVHRNCVTEQHIGPKHAHIEMSRKSYVVSCKVNPLSSRSICKLSALHISNLKAGSYNKESFMKCHCLGILNSDGATTFDWIPVVDQVLLMTSVFLNYIAGVMPAEKSLLNSQKSISNDHMVPEDTSFSGSAVDNDDEVNLKFAWDIVSNKLMDSLNAIENRGNLGNGVIAIYNDLQVCLPLLRLPGSGCRWLLFIGSRKRQVDNVLGNSSTLSMSEPQVFFSQIIQRSCEPICIAWLAEELRLKHSKAAEGLLSLLGEKLNGYDSITQNIQKSGKKDLYAELICILRFGSLWKDSCYDYNFFTLHGESVLEDLVISLADGIASMYLELISVDGDMSNEMNSLGLNLCTLSTRTLQRLRNEQVVLSQWLYQNMDAVESPVQSSDTSGPTRSESYQ